MSDVTFQGQCGHREEESWGELVDLIHPSLSRLDYTNPATKVQVVSATVVVYCLITVLMHYFFKATSSVYRGLKLKHQIFWDTSVIRGIFGFICTVVATWAIFGNTRLEQDIVFATTPTSHLMLCITVGFFTFENIALTITDIYFRCFSKMLHLHHWLSFFGFGVALVTDAGHHLGSKSIIIELSTPFSALCWTLLKCGREKSVLWKANQFILVHTFHLRSVAECMIWYISYRNRKHIWEHMPGMLFYTFYIQLILVTFLFTPHWTYQKTKQLIVPVDWNFDTDKGDTGSYEKLVTVDDSRSKKKHQTNDRGQHSTVADGSAPAGNGSVAGNLAGENVPVNDKGVIAGWMENFSIDGDRVRERSFGGTNIDIRLEREHSDNKVRLGHSKEE